MTQLTPEPDVVKRIGALVSDARIAMLTTMTADGKHVSRPMALQSTDFDGDLWFFAYDDSSKATEIGLTPSVNVAFANTKSSTWTSIAGTANLVPDRAKMEELWSRPLQAWFPDGLDTPGITLIRVQPDSVEYWDSPSSKVVRLLGMARAAITRDPDKFPGDNETFDVSS